MLKKVTYAIIVFAVWGAFNNIYSSIVITEPNGGENWTTGEKHPIHWISSDYSGNVKIEYSIDGGQNWSIIVSSASNNGAYLWTIPNVISSQCFVRIQSLDDPGEYDISDGAFSINIPVIEILTPNGGEVFIPGDKIPIHWTWTGDFRNVRIEYSIDGGVTWTSITTSTPNDGSYLWTVPSQPSTNCKIKVTNLDNTSSCDESDAPFTISENTITVLYPNGGEHLVQGKQYPITWISSGTISYVKIEYSSDDGANWNTIISSTPNDGSHYWTVPNVASTNFLIKISDASNVNVFDMSDNVFSVLENAIEIVSPSAGDTLRAGEFYPIHWKWIGDISYVTIEYSIDNGTSWNTIISRTSNDGDYIWQIPDEPSQSVRIRVKDADNAQVFDETAGNFVILPVNFIVKSPAENNSLVSKSYFSINWETVGYVSRVDLEYSTDGGNTWESITTNLTNSGTYSWQVPSVFSDNCMVKVIDPNNPEVYGVSGTFVIKKPRISIISPNANYSFEVGDKVDIVWNWEGDLSNVKLEYSTDNGASWQTIASSVSNSGHYLWTIPNTPSSNCLIKISNPTDASIYDISDVPFTILKPRVEVVRPIQNDSLYVGSYYPVHWNWKGEIGNVKIELKYKTQAGVNWYTITSSTTNDGAFVFQVPNAVSDTCQIKITSLNDPTIFSESEVFKIVSPKIILTYPNLPLEFIEGEYREITWVNRGRFSNARIQYSYDGGLNWLPIINYVTNTNYYLWHASHTISDNYKIKVIDVDDETSFDISDTLFTVKPSEIHIKTPKANGVYYVGYYFPIYWENTGEFDKVRIDVSYDGGESWSILKNNVSNDGSEVVEVDTTSSSIKLRIINLDNVSVWDTTSLFSVDSAGAEPIYIISPEPNETLVIGQEAYITWYTNGVDNIDIFYSIDEGNTYVQIVSSYNATSKYYRWIVPNVVSNNCIIKIQNSLNPDQYAVSGTFLIVPQRINIIYPDTSAEWIVGTKHLIYWKNTGGIGNVDIEYSYDGGLTFYPIASNETNRNYYEWIVPNIPSDSVMLLVRNSENDQVVDTSEMFRVIPQSIFITSPLEGDSFIVGRKYFITWDWYGDFNNVVIKYSVDGGLNWQIVTSSSQNRGYYEWTIPNTPSKVCLVKIENQENPEVMAISDTFRIVRQYINLIFPDSLSHFISGRKYNITWRSTGSFSSVKIEYSQDGGTSFNPIISSTQNNGAYEWTVPYFDSDSTLIVVTNIDNEAVSDTSQLFAVVSGSIDVINPAHKDTLVIGEVTNITWLSQGNFNQVSISYSYDGGTSWNIITSQASNNGRYQWTIPNTVSDRCLIRVENKDDPSLYAISDTFCVIPQVIEITKPDSNSKWLPGMKYYIVWTHTGDFPYVRIEYSIDGGASFTPIVTNQSNSNPYYEWTIPSSPSSSCFVKVTNTQNENVYAISEMFQIPAQEIDITYPVFGATLISGMKYYITWQTTGNVEKVNIEYSIDGGNTWNLVVSDLTNSGRYEWTVPTANSNNCYLKISNSQNSSIFGMSECFTIAPQSIIFLSPSASDYFIGGNKYFISWRTIGNMNQVDIQYSIDNGATWQTIVNNLINTGGFEWTIPVLTSNEAIIKISNPEAPFVYSISDSFTISPPILTFTSPESTIIWENSRKYYISWNIIGVMDRINIYYSLDDGSTWRTLSYDTQNNGYYLWNIPDTITTSSGRIKIESNANTSVYYVSDSFQIIQTKIEEEYDNIPKRIAFSIKNPALGSDYLVLRFSIPEQCKIKISLYDIQGRRVAKLVDKAFKPGVYEYRINIDKLINSTYFILFETPEKRIIKRFVKISS